MVKIVIDRKPVIIHIITWRSTGDKPLSETLLTQISIIRFQLVSVGAIYTMLKVTLSAVKFRSCVLLDYFGIQHYPNYSAKPASADLRFTLIWGSSLALCSYCHPPMQAALLCNFHGGLPNIKFSYTPMSPENTHCSTVRIQDSTRFIVEDSIVLVTEPQISLNLKSVPVGLAM